MKYRLFNFLIIIVFSTNISAKKLAFETLQVNIRAATMHFSPVTGHTELNLTNSSLVNDDKGYLWVGSQDGLIRLDGYQSTRFVAASKSGNALVSNFVSTLAFEPLQKKIWVGTASGLSIYDLESEQFYNHKHDENIASSLSSNIVQSIHIDGKGRVWIGTKRGLNLYRPKTDSFETFLSDTNNPDAISHDNILDIQEDAKGNLWIATQSGLELYHENGKFEHFYPFKNDDGSNGLVTKIAVDKNDNLWLGTEKNGLIFFEPKKHRSHQYLKQDNSDSIPSNYVRSLLFDRDGQLWVGTSAGLAIYDQSQDQFLTITNNDLLNDDIVAIHQDANDVVWIGTWSKGLHRYNPRETQIGKLDLRMLHSEGDSLKSIVRGKDDDIWFANPQNFFKMQAARGVIQKFDLAPINPTNSRAIPFLSNSKESIYLLIDKIYELTDPENIVEYELPPQLRNVSWYSAYIDQKNQLWLGSRSVGIYVLSPDFKTIVHHVQSGIAGYIHQVDENTMLIGSFTATYWMNINTFETVTHRPDNTRGMLHPNVTGYQYTSKGEQWLATSGGIHQLLTDSEGTQYYKTWTQEDGLPTDVLTGPLEDSKGELWFSSTNGLIRFDPENKTVEHFDQNLGALSNYYIGQYVRDNEKRMYFQGPLGISIIDERMVSTNKTKYDVMVDEFKLQDKVQSRPYTKDSVLKKAIEYTDLISLPPQNRNFSFGFTTNYINQSDKVKYFYRLVGFDKKWLQTDAKNRQLKYTNLFPGEYRFEIYSLSPEGVKGDARGIDLKIAPFFYEAVWFKILTAVLLLSLFFAWYKYRMFKIKQYNHQLEIEVEHRTQDIRTLADIGKDISSLLDIHELLEHLYIHLNKSLDVYVLAVGIYEPHNHRIKFERSLENGQTMPNHYRPMNSKSELAAWCIENNQEMILRKHSERFNYIERNSGPVVGESMQTVVYLPIRSRTDKMLGCITVQSKKIDAYKPDDLDFIRTIANYTGIALDNAIAHSELKKVSSTDFLTNLPNRRAFLEQSNYQVKVFKRGSQPLSFAMGDVDHFKLFNDQYGHECGDYVLQSISSIFRDNLRAQDLVARWGGEEFIFMLPNSDVAGATVALNKLKSIVETSVFEFQGNLLRVTITFGICQFSESSTMDEVINLADEALYQGKAKGRNRVEVFRGNI